MGERTIPAALAANRTTVRHLESVGKPLMLAAAGRRDAEAAVAFLLLCLAAAWIGPWMLAEEPALIVGPRPCIYPTSTLLHEEGCHSQDPAGGVANRSKNASASASPSRPKIHATSDTSLKSSPPAAIASFR